MFSKEVNDQYVSEKGTNCPYCISDAIDMIETKFYPGVFEVTMQCCECNKNWFEVYNLEGIEEMV